MNVKFHKDCENTGKILKISCVRCHFVKFDDSRQKIFGCPLLLFLTKTTLIAVQWNLALRPPRLQDHLVITAIFFQSKCKNH